MLEKDSGQRLNKIREMRAEGIPIYPAVNPVGSDLNRLSPVPDVLTLLGDEAYGWITYRADENGFRNEGVLPRSRNPFYSKTIQFLIIRLPVISKEHHHLARASSWLAISRC